MKINLKRTVKELQMTLMLAKYLLMIGKSSNKQQMEVIMQKDFLLLIKVDSAFAEHPLVKMEDSGPYHQV